MLGLTIHCTDTWWWLCFALPVKEAFPLPEFPLHWHLLWRRGQESQSAWMSAPQEFTPTWLYELISSTSRIRAKRHFHQHATRENYIQTGPNFIRKRTNLFGYELQFVKFVRQLHVYVYTRPSVSTTATFLCFADTWTRAHGRSVSAH